MKRLPIIITIVILLVVAGGGFFYWQQQNATASAAASSRQRVAITRGNLTATVSGAGNLYAPQQANLNFQLAGVPITKINVQVGQKVKAAENE